MGTPLAPVTVSFLFVKDLSTSSTDIYSFNGPLNYKKFLDQLYGNGVQTHILIIAQIKTTKLINHLFIPQLFIEYIVHMHYA